MDILSTGGGEQRASRGGRYQINVLPKRAMLAVTLSCFLKMPLGGQVSERSGR
jgi:hypothetical protein